MITAILKISTGLNIIKNCRGEQANEERHDRGKHVVLWKYELFRINNKQKNYFNLPLVWFEEFIRSSRRVLSSSICVIFQITLSLILFTPWVQRIKRTAIMTSCHCFLFRPFHSLHTRPIRSHALHKPKCGSPIFGKHHALHYTTSCNEWPITISIQGIFIFNAYISSRSPTCYLGGKILGSPDSLQEQN